MKVKELEKIVMESGIALGRSINGQNSYYREFISVKGSRALTITVGVKGKLFFCIDDDNDKDDSWRQKHASWNSIDEMLRIIRAEVVAFKVGKEECYNLREARWSG